MKRTITRGFPKRREGRTTMAHYHYLLHNPPSSLSVPSLTLLKNSPPIRTLLLPKTLSCHLSSSHNTLKSTTSYSCLTKIHSKPLHFALSGALSLVLLFGGTELAEAAKAGVNKPELLPKEFTAVIDVAGFLSDGQVSYRVTTIFKNVYHTLL